MDNPVIIFGANGVGKVALEIFKSHGVVVYGFLDDNEELHKKEIDDVIVLGKSDDHGFLKLIGHKCEAYVATDDNSTRKEWTEMLIKSRKTMPVNAIHSHALIAESSAIGHGNLLNTGVSLGANSKIGNHCLVHTGVAVDYDAEVGDYVQIGAGSVIGAGALIEEEVFIGSGAVIVPGVKVGARARIGAGSVVVRDVDADDTLFGNPAQSVEN